MLVGNAFYNPVPASVEYLVIAGGGAGGAGGSSAGGGGGAGGLLSSTLSVTAGVSNTVTIGAGGTAATTRYGATSLGTKWK